MIDDIVLILRSIYRAASPHMRFRPGHSLRGGFNNRTSAVGTPLPVHDCSVRTASISTHVDGARPYSTVGRPNVQRPTVLSRDTHVQNFAEMIRLLTPA